MPKVTSRPASAAGRPSGNGGAELFGVADQMVRRQHQQEGVITIGGGLQCGHGHCWSGVASHWLQQDRVGFNAQLAHLLRHDEAVVFIADQQWSRQCLQPLESLLGFAAARWRLRHH
jgi:hypothetical protein